MVADERYLQLIEAGKSDSLARDVALFTLLDDLSKALLTRTKVGCVCIVSMVDALCWAWEWARGAQCRQSHWQSLGSCAGC